jgi:hypothetical protein
LYRSEAVFLKQYPPTLRYHSIDFGVEPDV